MSLVPVPSASASTPPSAVPAPWRAIFLSHLSTMDSPEFVLSTLEPAPSPSSSSSRSPEPPYIPRARYCIFRGMWASLPAHGHPPSAARNDPVYESDLLSFTTDARMRKVARLSADGQADPHASGAIGPVEAVFWAARAGAQWRFRGDAFVLGPDIEARDDGEHGGEGAGARLVRSRVGERMRVVHAAGAEGWSWSWWTEVAAHFDNLSPVMRGSFKNPPPGSPVVVVPAEDEGLGAGQRVTCGLDEDPVARANFRVVVIRPDEVEQLDLREMGRARQWRYTFVGLGGGAREGAGEVIGEWKRSELWP